MSLFRRKRPERSPDEQPPTDEGAASGFDEIVMPLLEAGDWAGLIEALEQIDPLELDRSEAIQWHTTRGGAAERLGRRDEAVHVYNEGARLHPDSGVLHAVVGRVLEEEGRFDEALEHFRRVRLDGGGSAVMAAARYCYLWDAYDDARALLAKIFDAYFSLRIADDTFLYIRGLPFVSEAYGAQAAVLVLSGNADEARALVDRAEAELSDLPAIGEERLTLDATLGRPEGLLGYPLDDEGGAFSGFARMRAATWHARGCDQPAEAERWLDSVALGQRDFPWLEDVRRLARIAAARKGGTVELDDSRVDELFARQRLLLEPEHAFHFGLLDEQEILKERYRDERRRLGPPGFR